MHIRERRTIRQRMLSFSNSTSLPAGRRFSRSLTFAGRNEASGSPAPSSHLEQSSQGRRVQDNDEKEHG